MTSATWEDALLHERIAKARRMLADAQRLTIFSTRDQAIIDALAWLTLENDDAPRFESFWRRMMLYWAIGGCVLFGVAVLILAIVCGAPSLDQQDRD